MEIFQSIVSARLIFVLGIVNLVFGILVFFSCRCLGGSIIGNRLMKYAAFKRFYRYHCYIWWVLWVSVVVHAVFAIGFMGVPF